MNARAWWDDGHQVSIPGKALAELELAWRDVQPWSIAQQYPDPLHKDAAFLDHVEEFLLEEAIRGAAKRRRALLTNTGPLWSVRPLSFAGAGERVDFDEAVHGVEWTCGAALPFGGDPVWLMCRMSGLSIPLLPHEETT